MTRINKISMHGFKSFARNTELVFGEQFNVILGPNGSGKSNVIDALCFVLGRLSSKALRAEKTANLIYNGGKLKKPMKQGEVNIFFDNSKKTFPTDAREIKITRIIKNDGQSIYKINDKRRTRQQILELMSIAKINPEGYNIILQGDIVKFTEMHSDERRSLIEEISGISVYEDKKRKALRELEKVEEKLKEADIVLAERKTHLSQLKKDHDQAIKFRELEGKVKENKASYLYLQIQTKEKRQNNLNKKISEFQQKLDKLNEKISSIKKNIEEQRQEKDLINKELEEKSEKERVSLHKEIEQLKVKLAQDSTRIENFRKQIESIALREQGLKKELEDYDRQIKELNGQKQELEKQKQSKLKEQAIIDAKIEQFKKKNELDALADVEKDLEELDNEIEKKQKQAQFLQEQKQELMREKDQLEFKINNIDDQIKKILRIEQEHKQQIEELKSKKQQFKTSILELNKKLNLDSLFARQIADLKNKLAAAEEKLARLRARGITVRESIAGNIAVNKILDLKAKNKIKGIHGTVAELGSVDAKYAQALETAAGPRINSIIVKDDKTAAECIKFLKKNKLGIATFLPLNKIKPRTTSSEIEKLKKAKGVHGLALDLIAFDKKYKKAFSYIFGNTLVVDNIDAARRIGIGKTRMATLDGDLCEISGAMQGGFRKIRKSGHFQQKEITKEIAEQKNIVDNFKSQITDAEKARIKNEELIASLRKEKADLEGEIIRMERSLHLESSDLDASKQQKKELKEKLKDVDKKIDELHSQLTKLNSSIAASKTKKQQLRTKVNELRNPALLAELNAYEEKKTQLKEELVKIETELASILTKTKDFILPEKEKINEIIKQQAKERESFNQEIKNLSEKIKQTKEIIKEKEQKTRKFYERYHYLFRKRDKLDDEIQKQETKTEELREQSKEIEIKMNELNLRKAEVSAQLAGLRQEFQQYEGVKINTTKSEEDLKKDIQKFEQLVHNIGSVNMRALEIYEDVEREYNKLLEKKDKLVAEKKEVFAMMQEIESKKKDLFMKTLDVINNNFKAIFSALSGKGEASLVLENPENPFEAGLNIKVRLTGTKFLDIRSLSGGEKTLTALAFIFSIQEHEPHSFYILDEVDAALDKHNSEKLAKLIRKYADKAQYIMISHNDAIISEADNLYGVSMDKDGISKVVSLKL